MKKDKLNIDSFTTKAGKNYRKAVFLDKNLIENYFLKNGYTVLELHQPWRHLYGKLKKNNKIFFLKMASTSGIGEKTQNETLWNKQIGDLIEKFGIDYCGVPKIYQSGEYVGKFYYLSDYYSGHMLASKNPSDTQNLTQWIDKIVKLNLFFLSLPQEAIKLHQNQDSLSFLENWNEFFQKIQNRYQEVSEYQLQKIFESVNKLKDTYEPSINHGDFVPWHMLQKDERFILIDGEHASTQSPRYYDICYFYHRLYTSAQNPELAKVYLNKLRNQLSETEKNKFDLSIRPILATRIIGGFWDAKTDGQGDVSYHHSLKDDFLKNSLL